MPVVLLRQNVVVATTTILIGLIAIRVVVVVVVLDTVVIGVVVVVAAIADMSDITIATTVGIRSRTASNTERQRRVTGRRRVSQPSTIRPYA